jgi:hypothetical protein
MTLDEAYSVLGLLPLDEWQSGGPAAQAVGRQTGTTQHMLIELALDLKETVRRYGHIPTQFAVFVATDSMRRILLDQFKGILKSLMPEASQSLFWLDVLRLTDGRVRFRGDDRRSWSIYCDFSVKQTDVGSPNLWPFERIRSFKRVAQGWEARDRNGRKIAVLTSEGKRELMDAATCPISVEQEGEPLVSYPPVVIPNHSVLLKAPFVL